MTCCRIGTAVVNNGNEILNLSKYGMDPGRKLLLINVLDCGPHGGR